MLNDSPTSPHAEQRMKTFGDDKKGKVKTNGIIKVNEHFISKDITLVEHFKYKLLSVSPVLDDGLEISFYA
jgi:hypothetical protein